ncbi:MAG: hypothetical protein ACMUIU_12650 [bacterium]
MKKEFLIIYLILAIILTLTSFPGNKAEAGYYVDYLPEDSSPPPTYNNGIIRLPTPNGFIYFETKRDVPNSTILDPGSGDLPSESDPVQNTSERIKVNIFPDIMSRTDFILYSAFSNAPEWLWPNFTTIPSLSFMLVWTPDFSADQYWLDVYPTILFYFP